MTKREALQILIRASSNDIKGSGLGYRSTTEEWRLQVSDAIRVLYKDAYDYEVNSSVEFNLGLVGFSEKSGKHKKA